MTDQQDEVFTVAADGRDYTFPPISDIEIATARISASACLSKPTNRTWGVDILILRILNRLDRAEAALQRNARDGRDLARTRDFFRSIGAPFEMAEPSGRRDGEIPNTAVNALACGEAQFLYDEEGAFLGVAWFAPDETVVFAARDLRKG